MKLHQIACRIILSKMTSIPENFDQEIENAIKIAASEYQIDLGEYLSLRASNDSVRRESIAWLDKTMAEIATAFNSRGASIISQRREKHRMNFGNSKFTGSKLELKHGVRCLTLEAGWTQSTKDGILRHGALACARISHFGFIKDNQDLLLIRYDGKLQWFSAEDEVSYRAFGVGDFRRHFARFLL